MDSRVRRLTAPDREAIQKWRARAKTKSAGCDSSEIDPEEGRGVFQDDRDVARVSHGTAQSARAQFRLGSARFEIDHRSDMQ